MSKQVQQVRAEIEKCYGIALERAKKTDADYWEGRADGYRGVLCYIDSLQEEPVSENLEEAAKINAVSLVLNGLAPDATVKQLREVAVKCFRDGANWQYKQLMNEVVESKVTITSGGLLFDDLRIEDVDYADNVKLIIIKEE